MRVLDLVLPIIVALVSLSGDGGENYVKEFYPNGTLKAEGWLNEGAKIKYWQYYYPNGNPMKKGHYTNDTQSGYWYFYYSKRCFLGDLATTLPKHDERVTHLRISET